jgi:6-phosphofructokinase 1
MGIEFFINIGGNGTIKQSSLIARKATGLKVAAAPKTVDNDLGDSQYSSVLFTPGFPSCVNYWCQKLTLLNNENLGASSHDKVLVAQTFGRETGFIAGSVRFADPDRSLPLLILLPEDSQPLEVIHQYVVKTIERHGRAIVVMGEGYQVGDINAVRDSTGQIMYGSSGTPAAQVLVSYLVSKGIQARSFVPTIDQRQDPHSRTEIDVRHASLLGKDTVRALACGKKDFFISTSSRWLDGQFATTCTELTTAKDFTRSMPRTWINSGSFDVSDEYLRYLGKFIGPESLTFGRSYYGIEMCSLSSTQLSNVSVSQGGTEKPLCIL